VNIEPRPAETRRLRVLVVDDNADTGEGLAMLLALEGHETRIARSGSETCRVAATFVPQLVLIENWLPDMDGYEVMRRLRASPQTVYSTLVAITSHGDIEARERATAAGCDGHLVKPIEPHQLSRLIEHALVRVRQAAVFTRRR
jgi:CheY-like chemotaxis protein